MNSESLQQPPSLPPTTKEKKKNKIALLFLVSYHQVLHKQDVWQRWLQDLEHASGFSKPANIYVHADTPLKVESPWLRQFLLPSTMLQPTSYYHICPALFALLKFATHHDEENTWFIFLTDTCVPIVSATQFWETFQQYSEFSVLRHTAPWWNVDFHRRANLRLIPRDLRFGHDAWFILTRADAMSCCNTLRLAYETNHHLPPEALKNKNQLLRLIQTVLAGGLANESIFSLLLQIGNGLKHVISQSTHHANFALSSSPTSPHTYKNTPSDISNFQSDLNYIKRIRETSNPFLFFFRKIHSSFPSSILLKQIQTNESFQTLIKEKKNNNNNILDL